MPRFITPSRSGAHRLACFSLYHSLLSQCSKLQFISPRAPEIRRLIRTQFRRHKDLQSPSRIVNSLKAGYEALDLLYSCCQGNAEGIARLNSLLHKAKSLNQQIILKRRAQAATPPREVHDSSSAQARIEDSARRRVGCLKPHPDTEPILSRPRLHVSGLRRVPVFVNARGVPFLRIKKPQPPSLSRALRSKLGNRWKRIVRRERLENELLLASEEDYWDELVGEVDSLSWTTSISSSLSDVNAILRTGDEKNALLAEKMWEVVLRERELAKQEKEERRRLRRQRLLTETGELSVEVNTLETTRREAQTSSAIHAGASLSTRRTSSP